MPEQNPLISVLLAVYNGGEYLSYAIESLLGQDYKNFELIVVDNASKDNTREIVGNYGKIDKRIKYFFLPEKGKNNAYNFAFLNSNGTYICLFAADDILPNNSITQRLQPLMHKSDNFYSTCLLKTISSENNFNGLIYPKRIAMPNYSGGSLFFSRAMAKRIFPLPVSLPNEDTWISLHLRAFAVNIHIKEPLYFYRIHSLNSYGYGLTFDEKRSKFIERMQAYKLFFSKNNSSENAFVRTHVQAFVLALDALENKNILKVFTLRDLSFGDKLKFLMYSNRLIFNIRNSFFALFSGWFN